MKLARTSGVTALGLLVCLLACKKLKGEDEKPPAPARATSQPAAKKSDPKPSSDEAPSDFDLPGVTPIGTEAQLDGLKVRIAEVKDCKYERASTQESLERKGDKLVGMLVYYEGDHAEREVKGVESSWKAYDAEGIMYRRTPTHTTDCQPILKTQRLAKRDKSKGWLSFRVPASTKVLKAKYTHHTPYRSSKPSTKQVATFQVLGEAGG